MCNWLYLYGITCGGCFYNADGGPQTFQVENFQMQVKFRGDKEFFRHCWIRMWDCGQPGCGGLPEWKFDWVDVADAGRDGNQPQYQVHCANQVDRFADILRTNGVPVDRIRQAMLNGFCPQCACEREEVKPVVQNELTPRQAEYAILMSRVDSQERLERVTAGQRRGAP